MIADVGLGAVQVAVASGTSPPRPGGRPRSRFRRADGPVTESGLPGDGMKARPGFDPGSLVAGLIVIALGVVLLLDRTGVLDLRFDYGGRPLIAAVGGVLLACGLAGPPRRD